MRKWILGAVVASLSVMAGGQVGVRSARSLTPAEPAPAKGSVEYLYPEQVTVAANQPINVALHFRVAAGMHINSHRPKEEYLIPTTLTFPEGTGVRLEGASYPAGSEFVLPLDPQEKLSVYTGDFVILARIVVAAGERLVEAKLRYQACDNNACMPPRTLTVAIEVVGTKD
jgi:hypothetical protein